MDILSFRLVLASPPSIGAWDFDFMKVIFDFLSFSQELLELFPVYAAKVSFDLILVTGIAAFAGSYGAQFIVERNRRREYYLKQIRLTNAAIGIAFDLCNYFTGFKKNFVLPISTHYEQELERFQNHHLRRHLGLIRTDEIYEFILDFRQITQPIIDTKALEALVFQELDVHGSSVILVGALRRSIEFLGETVALRNDFIRTNRDLQAGISSYDYFGTFDEFGNVDERYHDYIESIRNLTDNCIQFSKMLCHALHEYGCQKRDEGGMKQRKVLRIDFSIAENEGLHPDPAAFSDFETFCRFNS